MPNILQISLCFILCLGGTQVRAQDKALAKLEGRWFDNSLVGSFNHNNAYNEIWGVAVNGREYAIIGSTAGTHFIDVTNPTTVLEETFFVEGAVVGGEIIHRDYHDHNGYLYAVADEGAASTLQIIDISKLPESIELVYDSGEYSVRTHNIFIDTLASRMYMCKNSGTDLDRIAMRILDISNPLEPELIYSMTEIEGIGQVSTVHDAYANDNIAYLNIGTQGFVIMDFNDIDNPVVTSHLGPEDYPQSGYNHSGYATEDQQWYYLADETHGQDIKALDLRTLPDIFVTSTFNAGSDSEFTIPHNLIVNEGYLYVSYYYDGLQIYDLADPAEPKNIFHYPTSSIPHKNRYEGAWGVYPLLPSGLILVSDMQEGLFVISQEEGMLSSAEDIDAQEILTVSPNPSNGLVEVSTSNTEEALITVYSMNGNVVYEATHSESNINLDLRNIAGGMYYLQYKTNNRCQTEQLVLQD